MSSNYRGEYDENEHDENWWALCNRGAYNEAAYGTVRYNSDYDYDEDNYSFDRYDNGEDT